ncbi:MAG: hypothetical protein ABSA90_19425 [Xanthobacteraceae bacterium]
MRYDANDDNPAGRLVDEAKRGKQVRQTQLVWREPGLEQHLDVLIFEPDHAAGRSISIYGIGHDQAIAFRDHVKQIHPRGAAIEHLDVGGQLMGRLERFYDPYADALIRQQDIAKAENKDAHMPLTSP